MLIPVRGRETGAGVDGAGVPLRQRDGHAGADQSPFTGSQHERLGRDQVGAGVTGVGVRGGGCVVVEGEVADLDLGLRHAAEGCGGHRAGRARSAASNPPIASASSSGRRVETNQ